MEREEIPSVGAPRESLTVADGDGKSKMAKRTVLKSVGDHTEVHLTLNTKKVFPPYRFLAGLFFFFLGWVDPLCSM